MWKTVFFVLSWSSLSNGEGCRTPEPVGVADSRIIPNSHMKASSSFNEPSDYLAAKYGRINSSRAWCAATTKRFDWLQVDIGGVQLVCGVGTQGKESGADEWTTSYWLAVSRDGITWMQYEENEKVKIFKGNSDVSSIVRQTFSSPVVARYVRFYPVTFYVWPCLRVEIYIQAMPPVITKQQPKSITVVAGQNFLLNCSAKGYPKPNIKWKLNGNVVAFGRVMANGSLWVQRVQDKKNFEGRYSCVATNSAGSTVSKEVDVIIHEKPRVLRSSQLKKPFTRETTAVVSCYVIGDPPPIITWTKDGSTSIPRASMHDDGHVLVIANVSEIDQGVYQCRAVNYLGEAQSTVNVTVQNVANITGLPLAINTVLTRKTIQTALMQTVNIGCYGTSSLPLIYTWSKDKVPISRNHGNGSVKVFDNILVVTPEGAKDYGVYVCHVFNGLRSAYFEIELQQFARESANKSDPTEHARQLGSRGGSTSRGTSLAIVIPLVLVLVLSIALNILLIGRFYKKPKKAPRPIVMSGIASHDDSLIQKGSSKDTSSYMRF